MNIIAFHVVILSYKIFMRCRRAMDRFASFLIYDIDSDENIETIDFIYV